MHPDRNSTSNCTHDKITLSSSTRSNAKARAALYDIAVKHYPKVSKQVSILTTCCKRSTKGGATVITNAGSVKGVVTCKSPLCANCQIQRQQKQFSRLNEYVKAFTAKGKHVSMVTLTVPHKHNDSAASVRTILIEGLRQLFNSRTGKRLTKEYGIICRFHAIECTTSHNGFHYHAHVLVFSEHALDKSYSDFMGGEWSHQMQRHDKNTNNHGFHLNTHEDLAAYVTKGGNVAAELTSANGKTSKRKSYKPFDLLHIATGEKQDAPQWLKAKAAHWLLEMTAADFGKNQFSYTNEIALKKACWNESEMIEHDQDLAWQAYETTLDDPATAVLFAGEFKEVGAAEIELAVNAVPEDERLNVLFDLTTATTGEVIKAYDESAGDYVHATDPTTYAAVMAIRCKALAAIQLDRVNKRMAFIEREIKKGNVMLRTSENRKIVSEKESALDELLELLAAGADRRPQVLPTIHEREATK